MVGKKHSGKADQSKLASGGNEHAYLFSVAISWASGVAKVGHTGDMPYQLGLVPHQDTDF